MSDERAALLEATEAVSNLNRAIFERIVSGAPELHRAIFSNIYPKNGVDPQ